MINKLGTGLRSLLTVALVLAVIASVPAAVWFTSGGAWLPPIGDADPVATIRAGQLPAGSVPWLAAAVVWACWAILVTIFVVEFVSLALGRDRQVAGVRGGAKKLAEYILRVQLATTTAVPMVAMAPAVPPVVVVDDNDVTDITVDADTPDYFALPLTGDEEQVEEPLHVGSDDVVGQLLGAETDTIAGNQEDTNEGVPAVDSGTRVDAVYTVEKGDTLWGIAEEHYGDGEGVRYSDIWDASDLTGQYPTLDPTNPDLIYPGNTFVVPGGGPVEPSEPPEVRDPAGPDMYHPAQALGGEAPDGLPGTPPETTESPEPVEQQVPIPAAAAAVEPPPPPDGTAMRIVAAGAFVGLAGSAAALVAYRRRQQRQGALEASTTGQRRFSRRQRRDSRIEADLRARAGHELWPVEELQRCWDAVKPIDADDRQMWVSRFNRRDNQLEGSWTRGAQGEDANTPGPSIDSPWSLQSRGRPDGTTANVWRIRRDAVPPPVGPSRPSLMPLMAAVGGDVFVNFDAVSSISIDSLDLERPAEGVVRALQAQLVGQPVEWIGIGETFPGVATTRTYADADQAATALEVEIEGHGDTWESHASLFEARRCGAIGRTQIVVGPADELQRSSRLLSIADTPNLPVTVVAIGPLPDPFATITLSANDADVIAMTYSPRSIQLGKAAYLSASETEALTTSPHDDQWVDRTPKSTAQNEPVNGSAPWASGALAGSNNSTLPGDERPFANGQSGSVPLATNRQLQTELRFQPAKPGDDPISLLDDPIDRSDRHLGASAPVEMAAKPALGVISNPENYQDDNAVNTDAIDPDDWFSVMDPEPDAYNDNGANEDDLSWAMGLSEAAAADIFARTADDLALDAARQDELAEVSAATANTDDVEDDSNGEPPRLTQPLATTKPATCPTGPFGDSGLRLELAGPIRLLHQAGGQITDCSSLLTPQLFALVAYLGFKTATTNGVSPATALEEFWPVSFDSPTSHLGDTRKVSRRVTAARRALENIVGNNFTLITAATHGSDYALVDINVDLVEVNNARQAGENCGQLITQIAPLVPGPALLTLPTGARPDLWKWVDEVEPVIHNLIRQLTDALIGCSSTTDDDSQRRLALQTADRVHSGFMADLATAWVDYHFDHSEFTDAEAVITRYENGSSHQGESRPRKRFDELRTNTSAPNRQAS